MDITNITLDKVICHQNALIPRDEFDSYDYLTSIGDHYAAYVKHMRNDAEFVERLVERRVKQYREG